MYKKELKQLDSQFEYNGITYLAPVLDIAQHLESMNGYLADIDDLLSDAGLKSIDHKDFSESIEYSGEMLGALLAYAKDLGFYALDYIDTPFKDNLRDNAVERINEIDINSYSTENMLDIKRRGAYNRSKNDFDYSVVNALTFADFLGVNDRYDVPEEFKNLTNQFANYYENVKSQLGDGNVSLEEFLYGLLNRDTPEMELKKFASAVLDATIVKPLIETFKGEDLITHQQLTASERGVKFATGVVGVVTLGTSEIVEVPLNQAAKQVGKTVLVNMAATGVTYGTGVICQELDLPVAVTVILCIASGVSTSVMLNGLTYKKAGAAAKNSVMSTEQAEEYAFNAIKGPDDADAIVLGKYEKGSVNSYDSVAEEMNAQYFNLENWDELSEQYSRDEIWKINERFLDIQTSSGREIYLTHDPYMDWGNSYYTSEIGYLVENGYEFVKEGDIWHAVR